MTRKVPIRFPREADTIYEEATAFRRLPSAERLRAIFDLIASGAALLEQSPHREEGRRLQQAQEDEWQRIQKELFGRASR